jgi:hypothetical protein
VLGAAGFVATSTASAAPVVAAPPPDEPPESTAPVANEPAEPAPASSEPPGTEPAETDPPGTLPPSEPPLELQTPPPFSSSVVTSKPLVVIPAGCATPQLALAVFEGKALAATDNAVQFEVLQMRAGSLIGYAAEAPGSRVNVQYGIDARFITVGARYLVGVTVGEANTGLTSQVREPSPMFGGDAVIGSNESDVRCPRVEDQVLTLNADGTAVDSGVFTGLGDRRRSLLLAVMQPLAIAFLVLLGLVFAKHLLFAFGRSVRDLSVAGPPPIDRTRTHRGVVDEPDEPDDAEAVDGHEPPDTERLAGDRAAVKQDA